MSIFSQIKKAITPELKISLSNEKLQQEISKDFPKTYKRLMSSIAVHAPVVAISSESPSVELRLQVTAKAPLVSEKSGSVSIKGDIFFDKNKKAVFIKDPKIHQFEIQNLSDKVSDPLKRLVEIGMKEYLYQRPVYDIPKNFIGNRVKDIFVQDGKIVVECCV
jgi:hypothetical protein